MYVESQFVLYIDPVAMERCFVVADILAEDYKRDYTEYGLIGLSTKHKPLHVFATPLLPGQQVTAGSVYQSGHDVFRLRDEIQVLSKRLQRPLMPIAFIHRHPGGCGMSFIDEEFLTGVFINQVSTVVTSQEKRIIKPGEFNCNCLEKLNKRSSEAGTLVKLMQIEYGVCFSMIINRRRQFSVDAVKKEFCPFCHKSQVSLAPADLRISPERQLTENERRMLRRQLEVEIEAKLQLEKICTNTGV